MTRNELQSHIGRLVELAEKLTSGDSGLLLQTYLQAKEFLRVHAPRGSVFFDAMSRVDLMYTEIAAREIADILKSFNGFIESGLHSAISPERQTQIDVVADYLEHAAALLDKSDVHPAAPAVIVGATLEEFLRTWTESEGLPLGNRSPSMDGYMQVLRANDLITKQDAKDITAWAGLRNQAAHGEWDAVSDKARIRLMLEAVKLFVRERTSPTA